MAAHALDVVLINPGNRAQIYQSLASDVAAIEPPVWAGMIATFIDRKGYSVAILDANAECLSPDEVATRVAELNPLLAVVVAYGQNPSASTMVMPAVSETCTALKQFSPERQVLLLGGHVAALPEETLRDECADFVCNGEGPYTLADLLGAMHAGEGDLSRVRGLCYYEDGAVRTTDPAPLVVDLDGEMPGIAWSMLDMSRYRAHHWQAFGYDSRTPYGSMYTTLGCPFHCSFCCIQAPFRTGERALGYKPGTPSYRRWSPETVLSQIGTQVETYGVTHIKFADELFVMNRSHVNGICDGIIERGYDVNIWAYARVDTIDDALLAKLKRAGVNWLCFGFEAGSERVRDDVHKGFNQEKMLVAIEKVKQHGIYILGNYLFGLPEDDLETMQETLDLATAVNAEWANFYCVMAYPGSELYQTAVNERWPLPSSWSGYSQLSADSLPLPTRHLAGADVLRFRDEAFNRYFTNPDYLNLVERTFGVRTREEIQGITSHRLVRNAAPTR